MAEKILVVGAVWTTTILGCIVSALIVGYLVYGSVCNNNIIDCWNEILIIKFSFAVMGGVIVGLFVGILAVTVGLTKVSKESNIKRPFSRTLIDNAVIGFSIGVVIGGGIGLNTIT